MKRTTKVAISFKHKFIMTSIMKLMMQTGYNFLCSYLLMTTQNVIAMNSLKSLTMIY